MTHKTFDAIKGALVFSTLLLPWIVFLVYYAVTGGGDFTVGRVLAINLLGVIFMMLLDTFITPTNKKR